MRKKADLRIPPKPTDIVVDTDRESWEGRTPLLREQHLDLIVHWYIGRKSQAWMAEQLGVSQMTISKDLKEIQKRWVESTLVNWDEEKNKCLAKLDFIEKEAIEAWERSKADEIATSATVTESGDEDTKGKKKPPAKRVSRHSLKKREGSDQWLRLVLSCVQERAKLFDLYVTKDLTNAEIEEIMNAFAEAVINEKRNDYVELRNQQQQLQEHPDAKRARDAGDFEALK